MQETEWPPVPQQGSRELVERLIPHRGKLFLLSRIIRHNVAVHELVAEADISADNIFYSEDAAGVPAWVSFEMMAQALSALASITKITRREADIPQMGMILSVTNYSSRLSVLPVGTTVQIHVWEDFHADAVYRYECELWTDEQDDTAAISATITVMETSKEDMATL